MSFFIIWITWRRVRNPTTALQPQISDHILTIFQSIGAQKPAILLGICYPQGTSSWITLDCNLYVWIVHWTFWSAIGCRIDVTYTSHGSKSVESSAYATTHDPEYGELNISTSSKISPSKARFIYKQSRSPTELCTFKLSDEYQTVVKIVEGQEHLSRISVELHQDIRKF